MEETAANDYEGLAPYGTPMQKEAVKAFLAHGSVAQAAAELGITAPRLRAHLSELRTRAARRGWSPAHDMKNPVPESYHVKGVSTYYRIDPVTGERRPTGQWVKSKKDEEHRVTALLDAVQSVMEPLAGAVEPTPPPARSDEDLLVVIPLGDPHVGMLAWADETGENFDLAIAERDLRAGIDQIIESAPPARRAIFASLGDFFHRDLQEAKTVRSGNPLDADGRWGKMLDVGIRTYRYGIERALAKFEFVDGEVVIGNHDDLTSVMLSKCMKLLFEKEPRFSIDDRPAKYRYYEHGEVLLGFTHGDSVKKDHLAGIMAVDQREAWGRTLYRHFYTGHVHHDSLREYPGLSVSSHRTLAARDAWHHAAGYRSDRDIKCDVWHRTDGLVGSHVVNVRRVRREMRTRREG